MLAHTALSATKTVSLSVATKRAENGFAMKRGKMDLPPILSSI